VSLLRLLHVGRRELGLEEDDWRAILRRVAGQDSLRAMSDGQRQAVLDELKRLGFRPRAGRDKRRHPPSAKPYVRLVHALWRSCHRLGVVEDGSRGALRAFCKRFIAHGNDAVAVDPDLLSYDQARPVIEALKAMEARGRRPAAELAPPGCEEDGA
jgi:phage gp16-like protein